MASRNFFNRFFSFQRAPVHLTGSFLPNNTSAVDNDSNTGRGFTVARTNAGIFTITLTDAYAKLISAHATIAMSSVTDIVPQWGAIDVSSAKTLVLNTLVAATATDIAANAANRVYFTLDLANHSKD